MQTIFDVVDSPHQNEHACHDGSYYCTDADLLCDWQARCFSLVEPTNACPAKGDHRAASCDWPARCAESADLFGAIAWGITPRSGFPLIRQKTDVRIW